MNIEELMTAAQQMTDERAPEILEMSKKIFEKPEPAFKEFYAADLLEKRINEAGFSSVRGTGLLSTAIRAEKPIAGSRLKIGFISEFDCLPNGHACGHNLIAASGIYSAIIFDELARKYNLPAESIFLGTPGEEGGLGKVHMINAGMFENLDYAMMIHPCDSTMVEDWSLSGITITFRFHGRSAHGAASPWLGANALSAAIETINMVNAWRSQMKDFTRVFPNITRGGEPTNTIPDFAELKYNVRSDDVDYHRELIEIVENCAECAAEAFGCTVEADRTLAYAPVKNNKNLEKYMQLAFERLGETVIPRYRDHGIGSTDMGNVTQVTNGIHGHLYLAGEHTHTIPFREAAGGEAGRIYVIKAVKAMVMTAIGLATDEAILNGER